MHPDLKFAGVLPPLDAPHHLRSSEWGPYREGVVLSSDTASGSLIDVGLDKVGIWRGAWGFYPSSHVWEVQQLMSLAFCAGVGLEWRGWAE